jgi:molybdenum cofactor synthesis domain-containing protein
MIRLAIVTVSDKSSRGERDDAGGPAVRETLAAGGVEFSEVDYRVVPDEEQLIGEALFHLSERNDVDLILTTGGTALAPRDVTPQITLRSIDYEVPGIAEAMRYASLHHPDGDALARRGGGAPRDAHRQFASQSQGGA